MNISIMLEYILGLPKTLYFNLKYFDIKTAIRLPVLISKNVKFKKLSGKIILNSKVKKTGLIKIGFKSAGIFDEKYSKSILELYGNIIFDGNAFMGQGSKLCVKGDLVIGKNFFSTAETTIICYEAIDIGENCLISWDTQIMDTDFHKVMQNNNIVNFNRKIIICEHVWIGCRVTILKGSYIAANNVVASNSVVCNQIYNENNVLAGNPCKVVKANVEWKN